jgi:hypothetical protein
VVGGGSGKDFSGRFRHLGSPSAAPRVNGRQLPAGTRRERPAVMPECMPGVFQANQRGHVWHTSSIRRYRPVPGVTLAPFNVVGDP